MAKGKKKIIIEVCDDPDWIEILSPEGMTAKDVVEILQCAVMEAEKAAKKEAASRRKKGRKKAVEKEFSFPQREPDPTLLNRVR